MAAVGWAAAQASCLSTITPDPLGMYALGQLTQVTDCATASAQLFLRASLSRASACVSTLLGNYTSQVQCAYILNYSVVKLVACSPNVQENTNVD